MTAFDKLKVSARSLSEIWLKQTEIISYGVVTALIADGLVQVEQIVREGMAKKILYVPLLRLSNSLDESTSDPTIGDLVLLLFVDKYNRNMFDQPIPRKELTKSWSIQDVDATGYNRFSGVGILLAPARGFAETVTKHYLAGTVPTAAFRTRAKWIKLYKRELDVVFDALPDSGGFVDRIISVIFGTHNPSLTDYRSTTTRLHGFSILPDKTLEEVDATVTETYSPNAPIVKNIQAAQTLKIGKGYNTAGDPTSGDKDVDAPISLTLGTKADITLVSESGLSLEFKKASIIKYKDTYEIDVTGAFLLKGSDTVEIDATKAFTVHGQDIIEIMAGAAKLVKLGNSIGTLGTLIDSLIDTLKSTPGMVVSGGSGAPAVGVINPALVASLIAFKAQWDQVFN